MEKRPHLVTWKVVCTNKSLAFLNIALLGKWVCIFATNLDGIWKRLINTKYGIEAHGWRSREAHGPYRVEGNLERRKIGLVRTGSSELAMVLELDSGLTT